MLAALKYLLSRSLDLIKLITDNSDSHGYVVENIYCFATFFKKFNILETELQIIRSSFSEISCVDLTNLLLSLLYIFLLFLRIELLCKLLFVFQNFIYLLLQFQIHYSCLTFSTHLMICAVSSNDQKMLSLGKNFSMFRSNMDENRI
jgi:hypothetical protein